MHLDGASPLMLAGKLGCLMNLESLFIGGFIVFLFFFLIFCQGFMMLCFHFLMVL